MTTSISRALHTVQHSNLIGDTCGRLRYIGASTELSFVVGTLFKGDNVPKPLKHIYADKLQKKSCAGSHDKQYRLESGCSCSHSKKYVIGLSSLRINR